MKRGSRRKLTRPGLLQDEGDEAGGEGHFYGFALTLHRRDGYSDKTCDPIHMDNPTPSGSRSIP
jgi:hypothetical protein